MKSQYTSSRIAGRIAVFSTLASSCALLVEYILLSQDYVGYFGFVGFLMIAAMSLWSGFYAFAKKHHSDWHDQTTEKNKDLQLQALFSTLNPWPVLRFDRYGQLISKNSSAKTFFYTSHDDGTVHRSVFDFFPEITKDSWQSIVQDESHFELEHNRSGFWLCFYFRSHMQLGVINVYGFDVTRYKRLQIKAETELKVAQGKSHQIGHLMNDTLAALNKPAKLLHDWCDHQHSQSSAQDNSAAKLDTSILGPLRELTEAVARFESLTELNTEQFRLHAHSFDYQSMLHKVLQESASQAYAQNIELVSDCDFGIHDFVISDSRRLRQALDALLRFSLDRSTGQLVLVKSRWIASVGMSGVEALDNSIGCESGAPQMALRLSVHDSGVFEDRVVACLQGDAEDREQHGQGLNLNLRFLNTIATIVGGAMSVETSPLGGHNIQLDWPVSVPSGHNAQDRSQALSDFRIHVFDPIELGAETIAKTLARAGAAVDYSCSVMPALATIRETQPQVIVVSHTRGARLDTDFLKQARIVCGDPVGLCLLAYDIDILEQDSFLNAGLDAVLPKPIQGALFVQDVLRVCETIDQSDTETDQVSLSSQHFDVAHGAMGKRPRVLVIDDDEVVLHLVSDLLEEMGVDVEVTDNGGQALRLLSHTDFDLVVLNVQMPVIDGYQVARQIRTQFGVSMPILGLTASDEQATHDKALEAGMTDCFTKPIARELFAYRVHNLIELPELAEDLREGHALHIVDGETPQINAREAIRLLNRDQDSFNRSLLRFYGRYVMEGQTILTLLETHRTDEIIVRLHGLRGGASNVGAYELRDHIFVLEKSLRLEPTLTSTRDDILKLVEMLEKVMSEASILLSHFLSQRPSKNQDQLDEHAIEQGLDRLSQMADRLAGMDLHSGKEKHERSQD